MNVNSMYQLLGAVQKNPKVVGEAVANGAGTGFEDMLQQAAGDKKPVDNSKPQNQTQDKPTDSQKPAQTTDETAKQPNQSEQNTQTSQSQQENQQALAAALVTSQPVPTIPLVVPAEEMAAPVETVVLPQTVMNEAVLPVNAEQQTTVAMPQVQTEVQGQPLVNAQVVQTAAPEQQTETTTLASSVQTVNTVKPETAGQNVQQVQTQTADTQPEFKVVTAESNAPQQNLTEEGGDDAAAAMQTPVFASNDAVPVKVMEAEQPLNPQADDAAEQLAQKINQAINQGESRVTINLTPANLGNITVEITRLTDGTLSVILSVITEKAAGLLDKHSNSLQNLLAGNMQGQVRVEVENRLPEQNAQQFLNPDQQERQGNQQNQEQHRQQNDENSATAQIDFMQQLRLGLIDIE